MLSPTIVTTIASVSGVIGLFAVLCYFYFLQAQRRVERSVRGLLQGDDELFNSAQVLKIIEQFNDDSARLEALKTLTKYDAQKAKALLEKVKSNIDVERMARAASGHYLQIAKLSALLFGFIAVLGLAYAASAKRNDTFSFESLPVLPCKQLMRLPGMEWKIACNGNTAIGYYWQVARKNDDGEYGYHGMETIPDTVSTCASDKDVGRRAQTASWWKEDPQNGFWEVNFTWCRRLDGIEGPDHKKCDYYNQGPVFHGKSCSESNHCGSYDVYCRKVPGAAW